MSEKKLNKEGGIAFDSNDPRKNLYNVVTANFVDSIDQPNKNGSSELEVRFRRVAESEYSEFVLQLAAYTRQELYQRTIPQILLVLAANHPETKPYVEEYTPRIVQRADEPATVVSYQVDLYGKTIPKPLQNGLEDTLHQFDKYQYAKYNRRDDDVNLRDVINLVHPTPQDELRDEIFERIIRGPLDDYEDVEPLDAPDTWETNLSAMETNKIEGDDFIISGDNSGNNSEDKVVSEVTGESLSGGTVRVAVKKEEDSAIITADIPEEDCDVTTIHIQSVENGLKNQLVGKYDGENGEVARIPLGPSWSREDIEGKIVVKQADKKAAWENSLDNMGVFAKIRNIRNMIEAGVDDGDIFDQNDLDYIEYASIYPFRLYQAYKTIEDENINAPKSKEWLLDAVERSVDQLPDEYSDSFVAIDLSGSMDSIIAQNTTVSCYDIATFFGGVLMAKGADTGGFGEGFKGIERGISSNPFELSEKIQSASDAVGRRGTNGWKVFDDLSKVGHEYDRVILLTDEQLWDNRLGHNAELPEYITKYRESVGATVPVYIVDLSSHGSMSVPDGFEEVYRVSGWSEEILSFIKHAENEDEILEEISAY